MASDLISRDDALELLNDRWYDRHGTTNPFDMAVCEVMESLIDEVERVKAVDAVEVVRCKDCVYWRDQHVLTPDGQRKSYAEMPPEAFARNSCLGDSAVTCEYGINCGSRCEINGDSDEAVFREAGDFCSRGVKKDDT